MSIFISMRIMRNKYILLLLLSLFFTSNNIFSNVLDSKGVAKALKANKHFLLFINTGVSNFNNQKSKKLYKKAIRIHYKAHLQYIKAHYQETFQSIRQCQRILMKLYVRMLEDEYLKDADAILEITSPFILFTKDQKWTNLLRLGYRALENAKIFKKQGIAKNRFLYSMKIQSFINAIKMSRRAKRFAFLAMVECKTPLKEKGEYQVQTLDDIRNKSTKEKIKDYTRVKNMLEKILERKLLINSYQFLVHHNDNYGYISTINFYDNYSKTLSADTIFDKSNKKVIK